MNAAARQMVDLMNDGNFRFVIPVYQRPYSWDKDRCQQLWDDVLSVGRHPEGTHFIGSIVWVPDGAIAASGVTPCLLIDGQQRMATLILLIAALADYSRSHPEKALDFSYDDILSSGCLLNRSRLGEDRYKLMLSRGDGKVLASLIDNLDNSDCKIVGDSLRIGKNYELFRSFIANVEDPNVVWGGIQRLTVVSISLDYGKDNPQLIFESMNSKGKDLSPADLIRNFMLMGFSREEQDRLYRNYWQGIEKSLGGGKSEETFDRFIRNFLTVLLAPKSLTRNDVYPQFKRYVFDNGYDMDGRMVELLRRMEAFARYYSNITRGTEERPTLKAALDNLRALGEALNGATMLNPLLLSMYESFEAGAFEVEDFVSMVSTLESYMYRRSACEVRNNSLNKFYPSLIPKLNKVRLEGGNYRKEFELLLLCEARAERRFPTDEEFSNALRSKDMFKLGSCFYGLSCLENMHHPKNPLPIGKKQYTIEHIMPQNALAHEEWRNALGDDCETVFPGMVNTLGNLTLTAYNSELADGTFEQKKSRAIGGYNNDYLVISKALRDADHWDAQTIAARGVELAEDALKRWPFPQSAALVATANGDMHAKRGAKSKTGGTRMTLKEAVDVGLIPIGSKLVPKPREYQSFYAIVEKGPIIKLSNGELLKSPSAAVKRVKALRNGNASSEWNGWTFWCLEGDERTIGAIRDEYLSRQNDPAVQESGQDFNSVSEPVLFPVSQPSAATDSKVAPVTKSEKLETDESQSIDLRPVYPFLAGDGVAPAGGDDNAQRAFWSEFHDYCAGQSDFRKEFGKVPPSAPPKDGCFSFDVESSNYKLDVIADTRGNAVGVSVWFTNPEAFRLFYNRKTAIQGELRANNVDLLWGEIDRESKVGYLVATRSASFKKNARKNMYQWIASWLKKLHSVAQKYRR